MDPIIKYVVPFSSSLTEFVSLEDASSYAESLGVDPALITTSSWSPPPPTPEEEFQGALAQGFPIPSTPYFLAMQDQDRAQFSAMLTMINEAFRYGYATGSTMTEIKDKDGNVIPISMQDFQKLMIAYGSYYIQLWSTKNGA